MKWLSGSIKVLATKPDNLSSTRGTPVMEKEESLSANDPLTTTDTVIGEYAHLYTPQNK